MRVSGVKLTYDDYVQFPDDGMRHEVIDGEHYVTPTPIWKHQAIATNLVGIIWNYLREPSGRSRGYRAVRRHLAPSLVVEIGSPSTRKRDAIIKRRLYERFGVDEYRVIDPELDTIDVYRLVEGRYQRTAQLSLEAGDVLTTELLPGLTLPLSTIFED